LLLQRFNDRFSDGLADKLSDLEMSARTGPPRPKIVLRPNLIERLNEGLRQNQGFGRKLTLISAPAGFDKTSLVCWKPSEEKETVNN
jgi:ATP/maltotriose-dependent transcriptional regulator MalT